MACKICGGMRTFQECDGSHSYEEDTEYEDRALAALEKMARDTNTMKWFVISGYLWFAVYLGAQLAR